MATITFIKGGEETTVEAPIGQTIAHVAEDNGIQLFGACHGSHMCCQCSREIKAGIASLLRRTGAPYGVPEDAAPYVRTCQAVPGTENVIVDCDKSGRF